MNKPTIAELDKILEAEHGKVDMLPSGEVAVRTKDRLIDVVMRDNAEWAKDLDNIAREIYGLYQKISRVHMECGDCLNERELLHEADLLIERLRRMISENLKTQTS